MGVHNDIIKSEDIIQKNAFTKDIDITGGNEVEILFPSVNWDELHIVIQLYDSYQPAIIPRNYQRSYTFFSYGDNLGGIFSWKYLYVISLEIKNASDNKITIKINNTGCYTLTQTGYTRFTQRLNNSEYAIKSIKIK